MGFRSQRFHEPSSTLRRPPPTQLRRAFENADRLELLDLPALVAISERNSGRRGTGALRELLAGYQECPVETRSALEHRFVSFCRRAGLPAPAVNVSIAGVEVVGRQ